MKRFALLSLLVLAAPAYAQDAPQVIPGQAPAPEVKLESAPTTAFVPAVEAPPAPAKTDAPPTSSDKTPLAMLGGSKDGKDQFLDITADQSLEWHEDESVYIARGHAIAKRGDMQVKADVLKAYNRKKPDGSSEVFKMEAEGNVEIVDKSHTVSGDKGVYDIDAKKATLTGENLRFVSGDDVVTAKEFFEYSEAENKITAHGKAKALREGRQVEANEMIAWLATNKKTGNQDIDRMEAKGNVHIVTKEDAVFCNDAVYNLSQNTAVLSGNVRITRGKNQLKGDKVIADFKTGRSKLVNTGSGRVKALIIGSGVKPGKNKSPANIMPAIIPASDTPGVAQ